MTQAACDHFNFTAQVDVSRLTDGDNGPVTRYNAAVRIACASCGAEFTFLGLPRGVNLDEPVAGAFGIEARLPIRPLEQKDLGSDALTVVIPQPTNPASVEKDQ